MTFLANFFAPTHPVLFLPPLSILLMLVGLLCSWWAGALGTHRRYSVGRRYANAGVVCTVSAFLIAVYNLARAW